MYRGIIFHETEEGYKIWIGIDLSFQIWHKEFDKFWPVHSEVSKISTLIGSFRAKYILFELKKYRGVMFHETEEGYKIGEESTCCLKIDVRNSTNFDLNTQNSQRFSL